MHSPIPEKPSADYVLRASAILDCLSAGAALVSEVARSTTLPVSTVIRVAAIMVEKRVIAAQAVDDDVQLSLL